jgi:hypothetical protein
LSHVSRAPNPIAPIPRAPLTIPSSHNTSPFTALLEFAYTTHLHNLTLTPEVQHPAIHTHNTHCPTTHPHPPTSKMPGKRNKASAIEEGDEVIDVLFILHEKFDLVDLAGPLEVFNYALTNAQKSGASVTSMPPPPPLTHPPRQQGL